MADGNPSRSRQFRPPDNRQIHRHLASRDTEYPDKPRPDTHRVLDDAKYFEEQMTVYTGGYAAGLLELKSENGTLGKMTLSPRGLSDEDRTAGATRAIEYSIAFYDRNRDLLGRNGKLERLKKMQEKGTLRQYVEANLYRPDDK